MAGVNEQSRDEKVIGELVERDRMTISTLDSRPNATANL
jgi:hypothetical protein